MIGPIIFTSGLALGTIIGLLIGCTVAAGAMADTERAFALAQQEDHDALDREAESLAYETRTVVE